MNKTEYQKYHLLADAAQMYYLEGLQQSEIAKHFNVSRSMISRLLAEAQDKGLVQIRIRRLFQRNKELEHKLCRVYGLEDAGVLILPEPLLLEKRKELIGGFTAELIYPMLKPAVNIGLTFGSTLQYIVRSLSSLHPVDINCIQLVGCLGATETAFDAHDLVQTLSTAYGCHAVYLYAPFQVASTDVRAQLFINRSNKDNVDFCRRLDIVLASVSPLNGERPSALLSGGHIDPEDVECMTALGVAGDIGGYNIDEKGCPVDVPHMVRMTGLSAQQYLLVPERIGVAVGEYKCPIITAALDGGWFTRFYTDEKTAASLAG